MNYGKALQEFYGSGVKRLLDKLLELVLVIREKCNPS